MKSLLSRLGRIPIGSTTSASLGRLLWAACLALLSLNAAAAALDPAPPNIILIFCDDLGYGDINAYGPSLQETPHLRRMADEGLVFTSFYSTSGVCTPSRSSVMTGCYPRRVNMHEDADGRQVLFPVGARGLNPNEVTVAEALKEQGYATGMIGKWHLGDQPEFLPTRQGFDSWYGIPYSNNMYYGWAGRRFDWPVMPLMRDETVVDLSPDQPRLTAMYTEEAVRFIKEPRDGPFFLYLAHTMPHFPVVASDRFRGKSENGIYGDAVQEIDWSTGQILQALKDQGIDERTLVIFTSDNGADANQPKSNLPLRGGKGSTWEGGMRVPCVARWPGQVPAGIRSDAMATTMDFLPTFAALAGGRLPAERAIDGHDIRPLLFGGAGAESPYEAFFYYDIDQLQAVRSGPWKLRLAREGNRNRREPERIPAQLYHLEEDIAESENVYSAHPDIVARLEAMAEAARQELGDRGRAGSGQRPAGLVEDPVPLVQLRNP